MTHLEFWEGYGEGYVRDMVNTKQDEEMAVEVVVKNDFMSSLQVAGMMKQLMFHRVFIHHPV